MVLALLIGIPIVNFVAGQLGKSAANHVNEKETTAKRPSSPAPEIRTVVSSQEAEGVTQAQMDVDFLKNLETYMVERATIKAKESLAAAGYPNLSVEYKSEATYVESGPMKLAIIRMSTQGTRQIFITGIIGRELKRVLCLRESEAAIPVTNGACADKIKEVFGVSLGSSSAFSAPQSSQKPGNPHPPAAAIPNQSNLPLDRAARAGDLEEVRRLINQGVDPNEINKWGTTALTGACTLGADSLAHTEIVSYLISHGADVNKQVSDGTTALNEASFWGHHETAVVLLKAKAEVNRAKKNGYTPLISAASEGHLSIVKLLVQAGADLNRQTTAAGLTALHLSSANDHRDIVEMLLAAGARRDIKNVRGESFTDVAGRTKRLKLQ